MSNRSPAAQHQARVRGALYRARYADKVKAAIARWREANPGKSVEYDLKCKYGLSKGARRSLLESQGGVCAVCKKPETVLCRGKVKALAVDHEHATGRVRGLLCQSCNLAIGNLDDNPDRARAVAHYLEKK